MPEIIRWNAFGKRCLFTGGSVPMLGMMFTDKECKEFDYLLRKEMDEMLLDMSDRRLDGPVKEAISKRYKIIFRMYARIAPPRELSRYAMGLKTQR
jgi:hypothetical protein